MADNLRDGDIAYSVTFGTTSSLDLDYHGLTLAAIALTNLDTDKYMYVTQASNDGQLGSDAADAIVQADLF